MKFKINDQIIVTAGKDKGKKSIITAVLPKKNQVIVKDANMYKRHIRKMQGKAGEIVNKERPLHTAKIAIINDQGKPDRIGYLIQDGAKKRIYRKTKKIIPESKA